MFANLILSNGRVYTQDPIRPQSTAVAIFGNKVLAVGDDDEMRGLLRPGGKSVDLNGRCVTPGLVDAHIHFSSFALEMSRLNLAGTGSLDEVMQKVANVVQDGNTDDWLLGRGWNQADWPGGSFPSAEDLDRIVSHRPVLLLHKSGHAAWVNRKALKIANIDSDRPDPAGGQIDRDASGSPTGILFEEAVRLVSKYVPKLTPYELADAMLKAQEHCLRSGLTGFHDFDGRICFSALQILHSRDKLNLRVVKNIPINRLDYAIAIGLRSGFGDEWLRIGGVKMFADGALGPRTASMLAPYAGEPDNRGIVVMDKEEMMAKANIASSNGLSVTIHAIGDRANHDVLDIYEMLRHVEKDRWYEAARNSDVSTFEANHLRHRIEHAQILHPDDFHRFAKLNVIASMQPIHATADMEMADGYWGERAQNSYAWRTLLENGAMLAFGSDAPVEPIEPLSGIHAAVTRRRPDGSPGTDGWYPNQRLSMTDTIHGYTIGPAIAADCETKLGTISPGKMADFTVFDRDIFDIPSEELLDVEIAGTIVGGRFKFRTW